MEACGRGSCDPATTSHPGGRRVLKLYCYRERLFLCRACADLTYRSRRESVHTQALSRAQKIRQRLGGSASMAEPFREKPKGMHWTTYERLWEKAEAADQQHLAWSIGGCRGPSGASRGWSAVAVCNDPTPRTGVFHSSPSPRRRG